ncbi:MAG: glycosyltransferase family 39 protein [Candidatus Woesebacteria bacterium]|nr:MAG: glycosyltransferase family 39 protein [Candidatus Woesebacteria bacterium]
MRKKIKSSLVFNYLLIIILGLGAFLRLYRINELLGFWFDQGRDALVIWDLLHNGKFFLIGPTTGLAGIFRGPWYYWLITPFYWIGRGNPVYPSIFLIFTTIAALGVIYYLGYKIQGRVTGLIAATIAAFSFYIIEASRWLSNPTPMLLLSLVMVFGMYMVVEGKKWGWSIISFCFGLSLFNFGSSGEFFYFPVLLIFTIWQKKNWPDLKNLLFSVLLFIITFAPLVIFDFKHDGILRNNIYQSFVSEKSFIVPTKKFLVERTVIYYDVFTKKIFDARGEREKITLSIIALWFLVSTPKYLKNKNISLLILFLVSPIVGLYFYQGNNAVLYDYYFTGYYLIFVLLLGIVLGNMWKFTIGKVFVLYFIYLFISANFSILLPRLTERSTNINSVIILSDQKKAIEWVYNNAGDRNFNIDVYVPPVIPYAYDYLFKWIPTTPRLRGASGKLTENQTSLLYTLYEVDLAHPERIGAWLERQKGIGKVLKEENFGGIVVQERVRI